MSGYSKKEPAAGNGRPGAGVGGSVRRARERAEAELLARTRSEEDSPPAPRPVNIRPSEKNKVSGAQGRRQGPATSSSNSRANPATIGSSISRPSPAAQNPNWPLRDDVSLPMQIPPGARPPPRGPPPQRPPRPRNVPSILDSSRVQDYTPSFQYRKPPPQPNTARIQNVADRDSSNYGDEDDLKSPPHSSSTPRTPNSTDRMSSDRPSTSSSMGTIPDFPVPAVPVPAPAPAPSLMPPPPQPAQSGRRGPNPGPPPVSRRGASSFYSQSSFVSPIPEEMPEPYARGGGSYASSKAMPLSWGSQPESSGPGQMQFQIDEEDDEGRGSAASRREDPATLVRKASVGQKAKPALTTIKSSEDTKKLDGRKGGAISRAAAGAGTAGAATTIGFEQGRQPIPLRTGQTATQPQISRGPQRMPTSPTFSTSSSGSSEHDLEKPPIANEEEVPLGVSASIQGDMRGTPGMSERLPATRRPPRLNIDAVKEAESRGSLTSLPDLIRRATRLASNLDRGKTASKLGMLDILNSENALKDRNSPNGKRRSQGSMSDILSAFPPPGVSTPTGGRTSPWPAVHSPSRLNQAAAPYDMPRSGPERSRRKGGRRCCGMPLWAFILLTIVLLLLVAAAVVIPVVLIVLPRQRNSPTPQPGPASDLNNCPNSLPCQNGGVSVVSNNACRCICTNGFTGQSCTLTSDASCIATDVAGMDASNSFRNATLGSAVPRLLTGASTNFSVPLNSSQLLSLFSANNLSCTSENALVTLNGVTAKSKRYFVLPEEDAADIIDDAQTPTAGQIPIPTEAFVKPILETEEVKVLVLSDDTHPDVPRATGAVNVGSLLDRRQATLTSNGIVYAASSTPPAPSTTPTGATSTSTSSAPSSTGPVGPNFQLTQDVFDFARIAVLFIFQKTSALSAAVNAQEKLQDFFAGSLTNTTMGMNGSLENFVINFSNFSITSSDGTVVGGRGNGSGQVSVH
ncbi:MAG: hypothetical protein Q9227_003760 [Pyrenula ochraceoflavens]